MEYDKEKYRVITRKNWMMIHWILNPGLAINELILGQRIPKIQLEDRFSDKPRIERTFVPCPHCEKLHDPRTWSTQNKTASKNWFGLYCPNCGKIIPCVTNVFSFIILALTSPIWWWFRKDLKNKWLLKQPKRFDNIDSKIYYNPFENKNWITAGLSFGGIMFVLMSLIFPLIWQEPITWRSITVGIIIWTIAGLLFGFIMKLFLTKKGKHKKTSIK